MIIGLLGSCEGDVSGVRVVKDSEMIKAPYTFPNGYFKIWPFLSTR